MDIKIKGTSGNPEVWYNKCIGKIIEAMRIDPEGSAIISYSVVDWIDGKSECVDGYIPASDFDIIPTNRIVGREFIKDGKIVSLYSKEELMQAQFAYNNDLKDQGLYYFWEVKTQDEIQHMASNSIERLLSFIKTN